MLKKMIVVSANVPKPKTFKVLDFSSSGNLIENDAFLSSVKGGVLPNLTGDLVEEFTVAIY